MCSLKMMLKVISARNSPPNTHHINLLHFKIIVYLCSDKVSINNKNILRLFFYTVAIAALLGRESNIEVPKSFPNLSEIGS